jgi:hypothetical protein
MGAATFGDIGGDDPGGDTDQCVPPPGSHLGPLSPHIPGERATPCTCGEQDSRAALSVRQRTTVWKRDWERHPLLNRTGGTPHGGRTVGVSEPVHRDDRPPRTR